LVGHIKSDPENKALVKMEKEAFDEEAIKQITFESESKAILSEEQYFQNDIYNKFFLQMSP
jgi:hypothetical protein